MKILNKELQSNLKEVCGLIQLNAKNKDKAKEFILTVAAHCDFFVVSIMEFTNNSVEAIDAIYFVDSDSSEKHQELINGIKATLEL